MSFNVVDIRKINIVQVLKTKWLQLGFVNASEGNQIEQSLCDLFLTYSKCYQFPVLVSKLFTAIKEVIADGSGGVFFNQGYIPTSLLKAFPQCIMSLPNQQALKLWEQFLNDSRDLVNFADQGLPFQAGTYITAQLFSSFLTHINLLDMLNSESNKIDIQRLIEKTEEMAQLHSKAFNPNNTNVHVLQISMLLIKSSLKKLKSFYYSISHTSTKGTESKTCCGFNFMPPHSEIGCDVLHLCQPYLDAEDKRLCFCMMNLLKEEMLSILMYSDDITQIEPKDEELLKVIMSLLTSITVSLMKSCPSSPWDMNINILDEKNCSTAAVLLYLTHLPLAIDFADTKQLASFCSAAIGILMNSNGPPESKINAEKALTAFFGSSFFTESKTLQTAFVTAVWDQARLMLNCDEDMVVATSEPQAILTMLCSSKKKWSKYADTTPKMSSDPNSMWIMVKAIAEKINGLLNQDGEIEMSNLVMSDVSKLIKVLNFLPLEYLIPGNQIRCLYGLALILILMKNPLKSGCSDAAKATKTIFESIISIFEGVRSIWLFDFVDAVPYIKTVIEVVSGIRKINAEKDYNLTKSLFSHLFQLTTRTESSLLKLEDYFKELTNEIGSSVASAVAFASLLQRIAEMLQRTYLQPQCKEVCIRLAVKCCSAVLSHVKHNHHQMPHMDTFSQFTRAYGILYKLIMNPSTSMHFEKKEKFLKRLPQVFDKALEALIKDETSSESEEVFSFISEILAHQKDLSTYLPEGIFSKVWQALKPIFSSISASAVKSQSSLLNKIEYSHVPDQIVTHSACRIEHSQVKISTDELLFEIENLPAALPDHLNMIVSSVTQQSSSEEFDFILKDIFSEMNIGVPSIEDITKFHIQDIDVGQFQMQVHIVKAVLDATLESDKLQVVMPMIYDWLFKLQLILNQTCTSPRCLLAIIVPSLNFISSLLGKKSDKLKLPRYIVTQCMHCTVPVDLDAYVEQPALFVQAYQAVWKVLSILMSNHCFVTLSYRIAYFPCVTRLMKAVIQAGNQELILKCKANTAQKVVQCADNLGRLFTSMTKNEKEFSKMVPYLIADYVDSVQHITLHPTVKPHLITGMNRLLDICSEDSLKMLSVNINHSCREIFSNLVKNYKSSRFSGQV